MKKLTAYFTVMIALTAIQNTAAQAPDVAWEKTDYIGATSRFYDVEKTSDGGFIAIGWKDGDGNALIVKTNANGQEQWRYDAFVSPWSYTGTSISQTSDGGYIAGGYWQSDPDGGMKGFLLKLSASGTKQWMQANLYGYNSSKIYSVRQSPDGTYIFGGTTHKDDDNKDYGWIRKVNASGNQIWDQKQYSNGNSTIPSVIPISDGLGNGYIAVFYDTYDSGAYRLIRYDDSGDYAWVSDWYEQVYGDASLTISNNGFTMIYSFPVPGWGKQIGVKKFVFVPVLNTYGEVFSKMYGLLVDDTITRNRNIVQTPDNGFVFVGSTKSYGNGEFDMWVVKLDADGVMEWQKPLGTSNNDYGYGIDITNDGGYIAAGLKNGKAWLVKLGGSLGTKEVSDNPISIYPNPVKDILNINSQKNVEKAEVYNLSGQLVLTAKNQTQIDMSTLPAGNYVVRIFSGDGVESIKVIKK